MLTLKHQDSGAMGGFHVVPWLFEHFDEWVKTQPANRNPHLPDMTGIEDKVLKPEMFPGDLIIFNSLLAHGLAPNTSADTVWMAQFISMFPADESNQAERDARIKCWRDLEPPARAGFPGDPRHWEKAHAKTAKLTPLGEKLLGLTRWTD